MRKEDKPKDMCYGDFRQPQWCSQEWGKPPLYLLHQAISLNTSTWPQVERQTYRRGYLIKQGPTWVLLPSKMNGLLDTATSPLRKRQSHLIRKILVNFLVECTTFRERGS